MNYYKTNQNVLTKYRFVFVAQDKSIMRTFGNILKSNETVFSFCKVEKATNELNDIVKEVLQQKPHMLVINTENNLDNFTICKKIKKNNISSKLPIIIIGSKNSIARDIIKGLDSGADDFFIKPLNSQLVSARLKAILRRTVSEQEERILTHKEISLNTDSQILEINGKQVGLTPKEFALLFFLLANKGKALSRKFLLETIWELKWFGDHRRLNKHIETLRKKLGSASKYIETVEGIGYRFN